MSSLHGLPVFGDEFLPRDTPTESAFGGRLQTFEVVHNNDAEVNTDLARFMLAEKTRIGNLVLKVIQRTSQNSILRKSSTAQTSSR